jgi:hypothetical protein
MSVAAWAARGVESVANEGLGEFLLFGVGEAGEFVLFGRGFGCDEFVLAGDRDVLTGGHGQAARGEPGETGQKQGAHRGSATADTDDQGSVGDQPVHGAEHRRP